MRRVCFHPTEAMVVSGSEDGSIKVWNLASKSAKKYAYMYSLWLIVYY